MSATTCANTPISYNSVVYNALSVSVSLCNRMFGLATQQVTFAIIQVLFEFCVNLRTYVRKCLCIHAQKLHKRLQQIHCRSAARDCCLEYSYMAIAPETCTFSERIRPSCGISTM